MSGRKQSKPNHAHVAPEERHSLGEEGAEHDSPSIGGRIDLPLSMPAPEPGGFGAAAVAGSKPVLPGLSSRRDPLAWGLVLLGVFIACCLAWWASGLVGASLSNRLTGIGAVPGFALFILIVARIRRTDRLDPRTRLVWSLIGLGLGFYAAGAAINFASGSAESLQGLAPVGLLLEAATYPIVMLALSLTPRTSGTTNYDIVLFSLDVAIVAWSAAMLLWHFVIYQVAREAAQGIFESILASTFPAADMALVLTLAAMVARGLQKGTRVAFSVAGGALALVLFGDLIAEIETLRGVYANGGSAGALYSVAWFAIPLAAYLQWRVPEGDRSARGLAGYARTFPLLPFVAMTLAFTLPVIPGWSSIDMLRLHIPAAGLLIALVLGRLAVTSRQNASLAAAERERLVAAVDQAAEAILTTDRAGHVTYLNAAFERMTGYPVSEVLGNNPSLLREYIAPGQLAEMTAALVAGESWAGRIVLKRVDGASIDVDMTVAPLRDAAGAITGSVAVARDVSHERALEVQLVQAQRMEAVGRLAGGIAHDFNNILTAISGFAELAAAELPEDHSVAPDIAQILRASDRAAALTKELLAFGRRQVMQAKLLSLNDILDGLTPMLGRLIGEDVELVVDKDPEQGLTMADRAQLEQVIVNLAVNARDAMPDGGRLTLATSNIALDVADARMHLGATAGPYVRLTVTDTGVGMTPEVMEHIFEPFYTTKERGKGTGLGLSTVIGIVSQSLGYVDVTSEPNVGSTFTVNLPRFRGDSPPAESVTSGVRVKGGLETILVAEDEDAVREFVQRVLSGAGYRVVTAPNGAKALEAAAVLPRLDLLFTDVVMPGLTGVQLAEALAAVRPNLAIVYASGYAEESVLRAALDTDHMPFLAKPFTADALIAGVREALDRRPVGE